MFGCFRTIGCVVVLAAVAAGAWYTRDKWLPERPSESRAATNAEWEVISQPGAARARGAVEKLATKSGPVFVNISPADLASLIFARGGSRLPASASNVRATAVGDRIIVRATVPLDALKGAESLGPLGNLLSGREEVEMSGTLDVIRPGLAQFLVDGLAVRDFTIPRQAIPGLLRQLDRGRRSEGVAPNGVAFETPPHVGDIRVARGRITLYKTVP